MNSTKASMGRRVIYAMVITACTLLWGCLAEQPADAKIIQGYWSAEESAELEYANNDTTSLRNLNIFAVCDKEFVAHYRQLPLKIACMAPDSTSEVFEWELDLTTAKEQMTATQTELTQTFIQNATLSQKGIYKFNISLNSSTEIKGVHAIGVEVENAENGKR